MLDITTGSLIVDGHRLDRSVIASDLSRLGVSTTNVYKAAETGSIQEGNTKKLHMTLAFDRNGKLKSIVFYSLDPKLSGWGDITPEGEKQRAALNSELVGFDHPGKYNFPWGFVQLAIDPREAIAKIWVEYL